MKNFALYTIVIFFVFLTKENFAGLVLIDQSQFGPNTRTEIFNGIDNTNSTDHPLTDYSGSLVIVGTNHNYVFNATGITLTAPIPNVWGNNLPIISAMNGNQTWSFRNYGTIAEGSELIPGGTGAKLLLETGSSSMGFSPYVLTLPGNGAQRVGGNWIMSGGGVGHDPSLDRIVVTAYGLSGNPLGTVDIPATTVANWANNFYGFQATDGSCIKSIGIDYSTNFGAGNPGVANLKFDPAPYFWSGAASGPLWNAEPNWGGSVPANGSILKFGPVVCGGHATNNNNIVGGQFTGITFLPGAATYTGANALQGNVITLAGNIVNQSGSDQQISLGLNLSGPTTIDDGGKHLTISGQILSGSPITKIGQGILEITSTLNYSDALNVNEGTVLFDSGGSSSIGSISGNGDLSIAGGGTLVAHGNVHLHHLLIGPGSGFVLAASDNSYMDAIDGNGDFSLSQGNLTVLGSINIHTLAIGPNCRLTLGATSDPSITAGGICADVVTIEMGTRGSRAGASEQFGTGIPEPSTFALLAIAGICAAAWFLRGKHRNH